MPRRKQAKRTTVKDLRSILRLTYEQGLSVRAISERLQLSKTSVATYLLRAREAALSWPLPPIYESEAALQRVLFRRVGRPPEDLSEPEWPRVAQELKRKGVTLTLLWQEYRTAHPDGYGYTWFCEKFAAYQRRATPSFRHRHEAGALMQTDYAGPTLEVIDPHTGEIRQVQIFVAVHGASSLTFAMASFGQRLPDWIEGQTRALSYFGGVPEAIVCDNLKAAVVKALWFEPTLNQTFAAMAEHYDTTILPTRSRKPRDKGKVEARSFASIRSILKNGLDRAFLDETSDHSSCAAATSAARATYTEATSTEATSTEPWRLQCWPNARPTRRGLSPGLPVPAI
jgi:transposase